MHKIRPPSVPVWFVPQEKGLIWQVAWGWKNMGELILPGEKFYILGPKCTQINEGTCWVTREAWKKEIPPLSLWTKIHTNVNKNTCIHRWSKNIYKGEESLRSLRSLRLLTSLISLRSYIGRNAQNLKKKGKKGEKEKKEKTIYISRNAQFLKK